MNIVNKEKQQIVLATHNNKLSRYSFRHTELPVNDLVNIGNLRKKQTCKTKKIETTGCKTGSKLQQKIIA